MRALNSEIRKHPVGRAALGAHALVDFVAVRARTRIEKCHARHLPMLARRGGIAMAYCHLGEIQPRERMHLGRLVKGRQPRRRAQRPKPASVSEPSAINARPSAKYSSASSTVAPFSSARAIRDLISPLVGPVCAGQGRLAAPRASAADVAAPLAAGAVVYGGMA